MPRFSVSPEKEASLIKLMSGLGIEEKDLTERFVHSSGPGGQNVNKTSTAVYLKHIPSGIEVKCAGTRSQSLNRFLARRILAEKIECAVKHKRSEEQKRREKIRRQKRKRSKRAKDKMLRDKKFVSYKKSLRKKSEIIE